MEYVTRGAEVDIIGETVHTLLHFEVTLKKQGIRKALGPD